MKHVKIECIGLKPNRGQSTRQGRAGLGYPAHVGGRAAHSRAHFGLTLSSVVFGPLLSELHDFRDWILFCCHGVLSPHLFSCIPLCTTCGDKTYIQKK